MHSMNGFDTPTASVTPHTSALLQGLNNEQAAAVTLPQAHALILAGAGSGKTRVLTTRIAWLMQTGQVSPGGILAVTFTNKAAKEMKLRLQSMLPVNVNAMWIGTFHGLCNRFLRAHWKLANLPQSFQILDTQDQLSAIKRLSKQFNVDDERFPPKETMRFIAGCKEDGLRPKDVVARDPDDRKRVELYELYEAQCQREGVVDFGELMLRSYELLRDNDPLREHYRRRFQHILVDEFQDTNKLQYAWLKQLAGPVDQGGGAILAVGDDDQSIYAFRGARVGNMADFVREYQVAHQIKLEQNYRSFSNILDSANHLISHNKGRLGKNLHTTQGAGEPVRVYESPTDLAEAQWMVEEMKQLLRDGQNGDGANGVQHRSEIAVLYRSNAQSRVIETALFNAAMPYRVYGGLRFFERQEIKDALAYLRLLENPRDDTSFLRVVNTPPRTIGSRAIEELQDAARSAGTSLHDAVSLVSGKFGAKLGGFVAMLDVLREQTQGLSLRQIIELLIDQSGLIAHYGKDGIKGPDRIENLQELVNAAESFVTQEGFRRDAVALPVDEHGAAIAGDNAATNSGATQAANQAATQTMINADTGETLSPLAAFLTHAALEAGDNQAQAGQDAIQLMTVHASKGLEFDCVFITGMEEGLFPHENSMNDFDGLEEERRLMYVAITRARKRLYLSHSQTRMLHGQTRYNLKSRFFEELPEHTMKWITPARSAFADAMPSRRDAWQNPAWQNKSWGQGAVPAPKPVPQRAAPVASGPNAWVRSGVQVFHAKFGEGMVMSIEGVGDDARAQVNFPRHGTKWLALSVAKLTQV